MNDLWPDLGTAVGDQIRYLMTIGLRSLASRDALKMPRDNNSRTAPQVVTVASKSSGKRAMRMSELPPSTAPPISIACGTCGNEMKLVSVDPTAESTIYEYQCAKGHRHKIVTADKIGRSAGPSAS
jgi:hypothetical protein